MDSTDRLTFFHELLNCNYTLFCWEYDRNFTLIHTDYTDNLFADGFLVYTGLSALLTDYLAAGKSMPVILELPGNLLWACGFEYPDTPDCRIHLIGPVFSGRDSWLIIKRRLDAYNLSVQTRAAVMKNFENIPAISSNIITEYAVMLHYCLTGNKASRSDVTYLCAEDAAFPDIRKSDGPNYTGIWYAEQQLCKMFADGDPMYKEALSRLFSFAPGIGTEYGDALRTHKNNLLVLLTLCSRACINGGLQPSAAYELFDYYAQKIEECTSMATVSNVRGKMLEDYITRVQEARTRTGISTLIENSCKYIRTHLGSPLSIAELARRVGYTEYYFSHKFKKEVGCSVTDFIIKEKIAQAKLMLEGTNDTIQSISDALSFSNRSYFYTCFQKLTGISPSEYRKRNGKL